MEEKILLQSEQCRLGKFIKILLLLGLAISILVFAIFYTDNASAYDRYYRTYLEHKVAGSCGDYYDSSGQYCYYCDEVRYRSSETDYALDEILDDPLRGTPSVVEEKLASMACKSAVKGNHSMSEKELSALLDQLLELENPYHCPHGRPTMITMSRYELEKKFRRIVFL